MDNKAGVLFRLQVHSVLLSGDGRGGLDGNIHHQGHPAGDTAQYASGVVGAGADIAVFHHKGVVVLAAPHPGGGEACPKGHPPHGGNPEEGCS